MLNLDETLVINSSYCTQRDLYIRGLYYSFSLVLFVEILRSQVPEIDLLQLIPGFYLILLFSSYFVLLIFSDSFSKLPLELDNAKILVKATPKYKESEKIFKSVNKNNKQLDGNIYI
jgi:hypothetical protein